MNELGNILKSGWKSSGLDISPPPSTERLIAEALRLNRESLKFQRNTILILGSTFLMMCYFLLEFFKFQNTLSKIGVGLMLVFFLFRILLEAYSIQKGKKKTGVDSIIASLDKENEYLSLRLKIQGIFTYLTLVAYTLGFLFLVPEFSLYMSRFWLAAMITSYFIPGIILTLLIRKNVQKELRELRMVVELKKKIQG
jgi:Ca2+/Na+ antiporter